jgi:hypothetical protein
VQWVGPDTAQPLTPRSDHLRSPTAPSSHRGAPGSSSRPKRLMRAREDRVEDGLPTVGAVHVVEVVDLSVGDVPSSRPIGAGPCWSCRCGSALARHDVYLQRPTAAPLSMGPGPAHKGSGPLCAGLGSGFSHLHWDERRYTLSPAISAAHLAKKEASKGVRCADSTIGEWVRGSTSSA